MNNKKKETSPVCLNLHDEKNLHIVYITTGDNYKAMDKACQDKTFLFFHFWALSTLSIKKYVQ